MQTAYQALGRAMVGPLFWHPDGSPWTSHYFCHAHLWLLHDVCMMFAWCHEGLLLDHISSPKWHQLAFQDTFSSCFHVWGIQWWCWWLVIGKLKGFCWQTMIVLMFGIANLIPNSMKIDIPTHDAEFVTYMAVTLVQGSQCFVEFYINILYWCCVEISLLHEFFVFEDFAANWFKQHDKSNSPNDSSMTVKYCLFVYWVRATSIHFVALLHVRCWILMSFVLIYWFVHVFLYAIEQGWSWWSCHQIHCMCRAICSIICFHLGIVVGLLSIQNHVQLTCQMPCPFSSNLASPQQTWNVIMDLAGTKKTKE